MIPVIYYWQPYFQELLKGVNSNIGVVHFSFNSVMCLVGILVTRYSLSHYLKRQNILISLFLGCALILYLMSVNQSFVLVLILFCILEGIFTLINTSLRVSINSRIGTASRASVLSSLSTFTRVGSMGILGLAKIFLDGKNNIVQTSNNFFQISCIAICLILTAFFIYKIFYKYQYNNVRIEA